MIIIVLQNFKQSFFHDRVLYLKNFANLMQTIFNKEYANKIELEKSKEENKQTNKRDFTFNFAFEKIACLSYFSHELYMYITRV